MCTWRSLVIIQTITLRILLSHGLDVDQYLNRCLQAKHHKEDGPGPEYENFTHHCMPWKDYSCCTKETAKAIKDDGAMTLYKMSWDHCENQGHPAMRKTCRDFFEKDMCFYECSPNMAPWIVVDTRSKKTRKERFQNVPLCANDCDAWFETCKDEYTCSDNWVVNWKWFNGSNCIKPCKRFAEYFVNAEKFCNQVYDYSFKYTEGELGKDCMTLWPEDEQQMRQNRLVAEKFAAIRAGTSGVSSSVYVVSLAMFTQVVSNVMHQWLHS